MVVNSSVEAEYRGMVHRACELLWIKKLLGEIGLPINSEMKLYCSNKVQ